MCYTRSESFKKKKFLPQVVVYVVFICFSLLRQFLLSLSLWVVIILRESTHSYHPFLFKTLFLSLFRVLRPVLKHWVKERRRLHEKAKREIKSKGREETRELRRDTSSSASSLPSLGFSAWLTFRCVCCGSCLLSLVPRSLAFRIDDSCLRVSLISLLWCPFCAEDGLPWNFFALSSC